MKIIDREEDWTSSQEQLQAEPELDISETGGMIKNLIPFGREKYFKNSVLVTDISGDTFRYLFAGDKKESIQIYDLGELSKNELGVTSDEPLDLHRAGMAWLETHAKTRVKDVIIVSSELDFFIRRLELPLLKENEIEKASRWELESQIPISIEKAYIKIREDRTEERYSCLTAGAVPKEQVNQWEFLGKKLIGIVPSVISLVSMGPRALSRELSYCYLYRDDSHLYIGFYNTDGMQYAHPAVSVISDLNFVDETPFINPVSIVDELANSIEVFYSRFPEVKVAGIVLFLSEDETFELAQLIKENIVIDVIRFDPSENIANPEKYLDTEDATKFLPLLGAVRTRERDFRFLPKTLEDNIRFRTLRKFNTYGIISGVAFFATAFLLWSASLKITERKLNDTLARKAEIENSQALKTGRELLARTSFLKSLNDRLTKYDDSLSGLYRMLGKITPEDIFIENMILAKGLNSYKLELSGYYIGDRSRGDVALLDFMDSLKRYGFEGLKLERFGRKLAGERKTENFSITGEFKSDG